MIKNGLSSERCPPLIWICNLAFFFNLCFNYAILCTFVCWIINYLVFIEGVYPAVCFLTVCVMLAFYVQDLSLRVTVAENTEDGRGENIGHVIIGPEASGMGITHWNQMLATLRKPVSMWHPLRRTWSDFCPPFSPAWCLLSPWPKHEDFWKGQEVIVIQEIHYLLKAVAQPEQQSRLQGKDWNSACLCFNSQVLLSRLNLSSFVAVITGWLTWMNSGQHCIVVCLVVLGISADTF